MKKVVLFLFILLVFPATAHGAALESEQVHLQYIPLVTTTTTPSRMEYFSMTTPWNNADRRIRVYLPENYDGGNQRYPVLYFSDGQVYVGKVEADFIMVGIDSDWWDRWNELSPWVNYQMHYWWGMEEKPRGGLGDDYLAFLVEVKSVIDSRYRTMPEREYTAKGGASMGGMFSIYASIERSDIFSKALAFSPAVWFGSRDIHAWISHNNFIDYIMENQTGDVDFWIYVGGRENHQHECKINPCPAFGPSFPEIYVHGAHHTSDILGGHLEYEEHGRHFVNDFVSYFGHAFDWLGW
jgi:predicted alpha/beta superfamily hydrolase